MFNFLKDKSLMKNLIFCMLFFVSCSTIAATSTGMPWEDTFNKVVDSLTGPIAIGIVILGIVVSGVTLILNSGSDMSQIMTMSLKTCFVGGIIILASQIAYALGGSSAQINSNFLGLL